MYEECLSFSFNFMNKSYCTVLQIDLHWEVKSAQVLMSVLMMKINFEEKVLGDGSAWLSHCTYFCF